MGRNGRKNPANETTDKRLISKIYKQLIQLNIRKTNSPMKIWAEDQNRHFSKDNMQMDNKHMKRYSTLLTRKMKIRTTMRLLPHTSQNGHHQKIYKQ